MMMTGYEHYFNAQWKQKLNIYIQGIKPGDRKGPGSQLLAYKRAQVSSPKIRYR